MIPASIPSQAPLRVGLVQISEQVGSAYYFPYSAGCLQAYAQAHSRRPLHFSPIVYRRSPLAEGLSQLHNCEIAAFSLYCWNQRRSLALAQALRQRQPDSLIVVGGPQVPDQAEAFLQAHPFVDLCVHGAGEAVFLELLEAWPQQAFDQLQGVSWRDPAGTFHHRPPGPRTRDLSDHPSPYLSGVFDPLLSAARHGDAPHDWKGVWETNRGCPFSCSFCDWGSAIGSKVVPFPPARIQAEADWFGQHQVPTIYLTDANFGILPRDLELASDMVRCAQRWGFPRSLMTQSAKNAPERVIALHRLLAEAGLQTLVAISLQSVSAATLEAIRRRNLSLTAFAEVQQACQRYGIRTYTDLILGLPAESYADFADGVNAVIENGQHRFIQFFDAGVLPNAELAQPAYRQRYGVETVEIPFPSHPLLPDGIVETQEIVIATSAMPRPDNLRAHVFAWSTLFWYHTHRLLQPTLMLLRHQTGQSYRFWIEALMNAPAARFPRLGASADFFWKTAHSLHQGSIASQLQSTVLRPQPGVMLSPELSLQIKWVVEGQLTELYREAFRYLQEVLRQHALDLAPDQLNASFQLSRALFQQLFTLEGVSLPWRQERYLLELSHDLPAFYQGVLAGEAPIVAATPRRLWNQDLLNTLRF